MSNFFFSSRRRHTRCSRDWSSDVCSSDLVKGVELRVTEIVAPGQVFMPFHYAEANANQVTQSAFDPISREPNYKQCAVRVEKGQASPQYWGVRGSPRAKYEAGRDGKNSVLPKGIT